MIRHVFKIVRNSWKIFCGIFIEQAVVFAGYEELAIRRIDRQF